ncbi:rab32, member RAS oncoprotein [Homalodisca vitripennis]|nr:rab32, member RAS oncoprotein [Homalodisca vitripennis]
MIIKTETDINSPTQEMIQTYYTQAGETSKTASQDMKIGKPEMTLTTVKVSEFEPMSLKTDVDEVVRKKTQIFTKFIQSEQNESSNQGLTQSEVRVVKLGDEHKTSVDSSLVEKTRQFTESVSPPTLAYSKTTIIEKKENVGETIQSSTESPDSGLVTQVVEGVVASTRSPSQISEEGSSEVKWTKTESVTKTAFPPTTLSKTLSLEKTEYVVENVDLAVHDSKINEPDKLANPPKTNKEENIQEDIPESRNTAITGVGSVEEIVSKTDVTTPIDSTGRGFGSFFSKTLQFAGSLVIPKYKKENKDSSVMDIKAETDTNSPTQEEVIKTEYKEAGGILKGASQYTKIEKPENPLKSSETIQKTVHVTEVEPMSSKTGVDEIVRKSTITQVFTEFIQPEQKELINQGLTKREIRVVELGDEHSTSVDSSLQTALRFKASGVELNPEIQDVDVSTDNKNTYSLVKQSALSPDTGVHIEKYFVGDSTVTVQDETVTTKYDRPTYLLETTMKTGKELRGKLTEQLNIGETFKQNIMKGNVYEQRSGDSITSYSLKTDSQALKHDENLKETGDSSSVNITKQRSGGEITVTDMRQVTSKKSEKQIKNEELMKAQEKASVVDSTQITYKFGLDRSDNISIKVPTNSEEKTEITISKGSTSIEHKTVESVENVIDVKTDSEKNTGFSHAYLVTVSTSRSQTNLTYEALDRSDNIAIKLPSNTEEKIEITNSQEDSSTEPKTGESVENVVAVKTDSEKKTGFSHTYLVTISTSGSQLSSNIPALQSPTTTDLPVFEVDADPSLPSNSPLPATEATRTMEEKLSAFLSIEEFFQPFKDSYVQARQYGFFHELLNIVSKQFTVCNGMFHPMLFILFLHNSQYLIRFLTRLNMGAVVSTVNSLANNTEDVPRIPRFRTPPNEISGYATSQQSDKRECLYKILVIGELGTGKTSIIKRYVHQFFSQHYRATIGVDFALKVLNWDPNTIIRLQLWDIAGLRDITTIGS